MLKRQNAIPHPGATSPTSNVLFPEALAKGCTFQTNLQKSVRPVLYLSFFKYIRCYISLNQFFCLVLLFPNYFRYIIVFISVWLCRIHFAIKMPYGCVIPPFAITIAMRLCHFRSLIFLFKVCKTPELGGAKVCFPFALF
jgi:hypothetical protein